MPLNKGWSLKKAALHRSSQENSWRGAVFHLYYPYLLPDPNLDIAFTEVNLPSLLIQTFLQNSSNLSCFVSEFHWIFIQHFWLSPEEPEFQLHFYPIGGWFLWFTKWNWMDWIDRNGSKKRSGFCYQWPFCCLWQINGIAMKTFVTGLQGSVKLFTIEILQL